MLEYKAWLHSIYLGFNTWVMVQFVSNYKVAYGGWKHTLLHRKLAIPLHTKHGNTSILIANMVWKETYLCWVKIPPTHPCFIMRKNRKERASEKRKFKALKKALKKTTLSLLYVMGGPWQPCTLASTMTHQQWSSLKCAHAFQCEGLQNKHTLLKFSNFFATLHKKKPWYVLFCIEYENNMMSHYIEKYMQ